jgi:hypothetical protein
VQITVTDLEVESARLMGNIRALGYRVTFTSSLATGTATFVPAGTASADLEGTTCWVEINQETIENFTLLSSANRYEPRLTALPESGDFEVVGKITSIVRGDGTESVAILTISVADASFTLTSDDVGSGYREGDFVTFIARDVSLWDEAI